MQSVPSSAPPSEGVLDDVLDLLLGAIRRIAPEIVSRTEADVASGLSRIPTELNEYGYDAWGFSPDTSRRAFTLVGLLYRHWFRVEMHGVENLPAGRALVVANHSGQLPFDAALTPTRRLRQPFELAPALLLTRISVTPV